LLCVLLVGASHLLIDALRLKVEDRIFSDPQVRQPHTKREGLNRLRAFLKDPHTSWSEAWFRRWLVINAVDQSLHLAVLVLVAAYLARVL
jgi:hypothetical protein